jgi:hypothetical protein
MMNVNEQAFYFSRSKEEGEEANPGSERVRKTPAGREMGRRE